MRQKVLVAIDFSENSRRALAAAIDFVQSHEAEIYLYYVVENSNRLGGFKNAANKLDDDMERMKDMMIRELERLANEWGRKPVVGEVHRRIANGKPWEEILRMAGGVTADVIFLGASKKGKNAAKVVEHAPCNVVVAREKDMEYVFTD